MGSKASASAIPEKPLLTPDERALVASVGDQILSQYVTPKTVIAAVGSSPLIITAYLQARLGSHRLVHIPWSNLGMSSPNEISSLDANGRKIFWNYVFLHLDAFLGEHGFDTTTHFLVTDLSVSGDTFKTFRFLFERYLQEHGWHRVTYLRLVTKPNTRSGYESLFLPTKLGSKMARRHFFRLNAYTKTPFFLLLEWYRKHYRETNIGEKYLRHLESFKQPKAWETFHEVVEKWKTEWRPNRRDCEERMD